MNKISSSDKNRKIGILEKIALDRVRAQCAPGKTDPKYVLSWPNNGVPEVTVEEADMGSYVDSQVTAKWLLNHSISFIKNYCERVGFYRSRFSEFIKVERNCRNRKILLKYLFNKIKG